MLALFKSKKPEPAARTKAEKIQIPSAPGNDVGQTRQSLFKFQGQTMGTLYRVSVVAAQHINLESVRNEIQAAVDQVDNQMSTWKPDSALSRFNQARYNRLSPGEWFAVPAQLAYVVSEALKLSALTEGAFDVTLGSAVNLWGFGPPGKCRQLPDTNKIQHSKFDGGHEKLEARLEPPALRKTSECYVDLSAIAKGFAVDQMAQVLEDRDIRNYLVAIDGEVRVRGSKIPTDSPWTLAVETPVRGTRQAYDLLQPRDCSVATSGDYRNFVVLDDKHYSHTIDRTTGRPIDNGVGSVTVTHRSCMMADAWATALSVLGPDKGSELAKSHQIAALFLLRENGEIRDIMTPLFAAVI